MWLHPLQLLLSACMRSLHSPESTPWVSTVRTWQRKQADYNDAIAISFYSPQILQILAFHIPFYNHQATLPLRGSSRWVWQDIDDHLLQSLFWVIPKPSTWVSTVSTGKFEHDYVSLQREHRSIQQRSHKGAGRSNTQYCNSLPILTLTRGTSYKAVLSCVLVLCTKLRI